MKPKCRTGIVAAFAVIAVGLAACTATIDSADLESQLAEQFGEETGIEGLEVSCPDDIEAEQGKTFECEVSAPDGTSQSVEVTLTDDEGGFEAEPVGAAAQDDGDTPTVDAATLESEIKQQLEEQRPAGGSIEIDCPTDVPDVAGTEFLCVLTAEDGSQADVAVVLTEGGFEAEVLPPSSE